jgi:hypothetical protein
VREVGRRRNRELIRCVDAGHGSRQKTAVKNISQLALISMCLGTEEVVNRPWELREGILKLAAPAVTARGWYHFASTRLGHLRG